MTELHYLSAAETVRGFRDSTLSPVEVAEAIIARIHEVEGDVNAFTERDLDTALVAAKEAEDRYRTGTQVGPLDGLLVAVKDEHDIIGRSSSNGSRLLADAVADRNHPVVERLLAAGGIIHGRTATPEFSIVPWTHTEMWGVTRNPWNRAMSPGGSSGGSAAALAAGMAHLATGSDIGGSIRQPASMCGIVGFKPPFGRVAALPPYNQDSYCADGPLARTVADVVLFQNVLAGPHIHDNAAVAPRYVLPERPEDVRGLKVALSVNLGAYAVDAAVDDNTRRAAQHLRDAGAVVEEVHLPWSPEKATWLALRHLGPMLVEMYADLTDDARQLLMPYTQDFVKRAQDVLGRSSLSESLVAETEFYRPLGDVLSQFDALLCPTWATQGIPAGDDLVDGRLPLDDTDVPWAEALMTMPFNIASRVPVLNLPSGRSPNGVPTGVQIVGRPYDDATVFRVGAALEGAQALWDTPEWRPDF